MADGGGSMGSGTGGAPNNLLLCAPVSSGIYGRRQNQPLRTV